MIALSENSRALQVLHYDLEEVEKNYNYFGNESTLEQSESLLATVILYLSNVTRGGEILFPKSEVRLNLSSFTCMHRGLEFSVLN